MEAIIVGLVVLISGLLFIISSYQKVRRQAQVRDWPELEVAKQTKLAQMPAAGSSRLSWATPTAKRYQDTVAEWKLRGVLVK